MRVLLIVHQFFPEFCGGTEHVALNLAKAAQRAGHYVHVLACTVDPAVKSWGRCDEVKGALQTVYEGVPVSLLPRELLPAAADVSLEADLALVEQLVQWLGRERFDIAHVLHPMRMGSALLAIQRSGLPYLITLTDFFLACFRINLVNTRGQICEGPLDSVRCTKDCLVGMWTRDSLATRHRQAYDLLAAAGERVCPSKFVANSYRHAFPGLDFRVIPHGIDLMASMKGGTSLSKPVKKGLTLGFIGSVVPEKGLDTLLRAIAEVPASPLKLRVAGGFYGSSNYHHEIKRLAAADSRVEILGRVSQAQVFEVLKTIDVLCLPSRVPETFSLVLQEAATVGVPALVSDLGAPTERIADEGGGQILPAGDVSAWANAIAELMTYPQRIDAWRGELPLPLRIEEEAFFYESLYRRLLLRATQGSADMS